MTRCDVENILRKPISKLLDEASANKQHGMTFVSSSNDKNDVVSYAALGVDVRRFATMYLREGVRRGDRVALMIPDSRSFVTAFFAALHLGAVPVPIYPPMRVDSLGDYLQQTRRIVESAEATLIVTSKEIRRVLGSLVRTTRRMIIVEALWQERDEASLATRSMDDLAFLQFTSGSTGNPKGVMVSFNNIATNIACISQRLEIDPTRDVVVSWLPLYHDMGLIGCVLTSVGNQMPLVLIPPLDFLKRPVSWLKHLSQHERTLSFAPNFAYGLATRRVRDKELEGLDLSGWRIAGCGAEPIHRPTLQAFARRFEAVGFNEKALLPSYGLAESTLAVSFVSLGSGVTSLHVSRQVLLGEGRAVLIEADSPDAEEVVLCGSAFEDHEITVLGDDGPLTDGFVGEIALRGPSVTSGYFNAPDINKELFHDGWLRTGDLGFLCDGQLVICGREKDLIIINGRNYYASDIESAVIEVEGVRRGQATAFGVAKDTREEAVVCVELQAEINAEGVVAEIRAAVMERFGLKISEVVIIPRGATPKTSSGKVRRREARSMYLNDQFDSARDNRLTTAKHLARSQAGLLRQQFSSVLGRLNPKKR